jgi:hypothetical protein
MDPCYEYAPETLKRSFCLFIDRDSRKTEKGETAVTQNCGNHEKDMVKTSLLDDC